MHQHSEETVLRVSEENTLHLNRSQTGSSFIRLNLVTNINTVSYYLSSRAYILGSGIEYCGDYQKVCLWQ